MLTTGVCLEELYRLMKSSLLLVDGVVIAKSGVCLIANSELSSKGTKIE
jgi:hypothetical protein